MNEADWALISIITISALISIKRGFVREVLSLITWVIAVLVVLVFSEKLATVLTGLIATPSVRMTVSMVSLFAATLIVGALINHLMADLLKKTGLKGTDRFFGVFFGLLRGFIVVLVLVMLAKSSFSLDPWWQESRLIPRFVALESWALSSWDSIRLFFGELVSDF